MIDVLMIVVVVMMFAISIGSIVIGVVVSRRAWKRYGWEEMKLVYRGLVLGPVIGIVGSLGFALLGWILDGSGYGTIEAIRVVQAGIAVGGGVATVMVAVGLYRLARRGALPRA